MKFRMVHNNLNVFDLDKSIKFYQDAFDMKEVKRINASDGSFIIVYLEDGNSSHRLELTWLRDMDRPYKVEPSLLQLLSTNPDALPTMHPTIASADIFPLHTARSIIEASEFV